MDLRKKEGHKVERELACFKRRMLYRNSREDIWNACGKIHFYCCLNEYFLFNEKIPTVYLELAVLTPGFLDLVWKVYLNADTDHSGYQTWEEIDRLLEAVLMQWNLPLAG